jgi:hypothetical protein
MKPNASLNDARLSIKEGMAAPLDTSSRKLDW